MKTPKRAVRFGVLSLFISLSTDTAGSSAAKIASELLCTQLVYDFISRFVDAGEGADTQSLGQARDEVFLAAFIHGFARMFFDDLAGPFREVDDVYDNQPACKSAYGNTTVSSILKSSGA